jgi:hypothetical protein
MFVLENQIMQSLAEVNMAECKELRQARCGGTYLQSQLLRRWKLEGLLFEASLGKKLSRSHLNQQNGQGSPYL